jgi:hypothetical protein
MLLLHVWKRCVFLKHNLTSDYLWTLEQRWAGILISRWFELAGLFKGIPKPLTKNIYAYKRNEFTLEIADVGMWFYLQCAYTDVVAGWCESGSIFVADVRQDLLSAIGV